ncbi:hypothetical protein [Pseudomonas sp. KUIN-1]|uniref:hypothetical protein n=1 Tax=Pseudomonas sp. KUIN-1 TaxID=2609418 RepID=UPI0012A0440B|nr:hypothetical protein [Pseudomonas sp. KUIN-1]BBN64590.1 hypothetical protein KUIN1_37800 [Pseudomonas sp. KUIN-1]
MQWIDETGLAKWAKRIDARAHLPDLIADLIRASITDASRFRFPGGDAGQIRGWDGVLETAGPAEFVPAGKSKWEFGAGAGARKATDDYNKRTGKTDPVEMAESTLVLVNLEKWDTPRELLTEWEDERTREGKWKKVIYLDAVELVHWLDLHPAVAALYARDVLGNAPRNGALSTDEFWEMYSLRFKPRLHEKVVLGDRQEVAEELLQNLAGPAQAIMLGAETGIEVVAFAVAAIRMAPPDIKRALEVKTLIVETEAAARFLSQRTNLIFITTNDGDRMSGVLSAKGPTLSAVTGVQARKHKSLKRSSATGMVDGFTAMGIERDEGYELAHRCGRSLTILERLISNRPYSPPEWVSGAAGMKAAFLAGGWSINQKLDRLLVAELSGVGEYSDLEEKLLPSTMLADPPFDRVGEYWQVRAPVDAFSFYGQLIGEQDLQRLKAAVLKVFSHVVEEPSRDEKFTLHYVSPADYSKWLREGLALTLLIIATMDQVGGLYMNQATAQQFVDEILSSLPEWGKNHRTLVGLSGQTTLIAEAAPSPFLTALESMFEGEQDKIVGLFHDKDDWSVGASGPYIQILWALEVLAWDPKLLNRAAIVLAKLAELDPTPDSNRVNRPINSLRDILLTWSPNTHATLRQRIACIDSVLSNVPAVGWQLLVKLLPRSHDSVSPTQKPKLRDVASVNPEELTFGVVWDAQHAVVSRAIKLAADNEERAIVLVNSFSAFRPDDREAVLAFIDTYLATHQSDGASPVWSALQAMAAKHEFYADSDWAIEEEERLGIQSLLDKHRPVDPIYQDKQLFDDWLPHIGRYQEITDFEPDALRKEALVRILERAGPLGILELTKKVAIPMLVAQAIDIEQITQTDLVTLVEATVIQSPVPELALYASALGAQRYGDSWSQIIEAKIFPLVPDAGDKCYLLLGWPVNSWTWDFVESQGPEVHEQYWRRLNIVPNEGASDDLMRVVKEFRAVERSLDVLCLGHRRLAEFDSEMIVALLSEGLRQSDSKQNGTMLSYYLESAFKELDGRDDVEPLAIARLEYAYLPAIQDQRRPLVIYKQMAEDSDIFVEILSHVFRGKNSPARKELTARERNIASVSFRLLSAFETLPGATAEGVDQAKLESWIAGVRTAAVERDIADIADQHIGKTFAHSPRFDVAAIWPPTEVCMVIENLASEQIETGFEMECFNKRGAYMKSFGEGGAQERVLARQYSSWAALAVEFTRTSAMLERVSESWSRMADREDLSAEVDKLKR